jgi:hypothetical protein
MSQLVGEFEGRSFSRLVRLRNKQAKRKNIRIETGPKKEVSEERGQMRDFW